MKILHYIPNLTKNMGQATKSVQVLHMALARSTESHLYTGNASSMDFYRYVTALHPNIIHLHGCWNSQLLAALCVAHHLDIPVVTSPHGALSAQNIQQDFWKQRLPRIIAYQFICIRRSFAVHAESDEELADLKSLGWKKRAIVIPIAKEPLEEGPMVRQHIEFYKKVIDTTLRNRFSEIERKCFWALILAEINSRYDDVALDEETTKMLTTLNEDNWKQIQIYALDHDVYGRIVNAAKLLKLTIPNPISTLPPRYDHKAIWKDEKATAIADDIITAYKDYQPELTLATKINDLHNTLIELHKTSNCTYPMVTFLEVYETFRWQYYHEDVFCDIITKAGLGKFCGQLVNTYSQLFNLQIGFMPLPPIKDHTSTTIINNLNNLP